MKAAMEAVAAGQSVSEAAREHGIPKTTLHDRVSGKVIHGVKPGPRPYLSPKEEGNLGLFLKQCAKLGYGKTRKDVLGIVQSTAVDKGLLRSSRVTECWWRRFLERQSDLSLRQGDSTAHVRMEADEKEQRKKEREEKKRQREEECKRKAEERARKAAENTKKAKSSMKRKAETASSSLNTRGEMQSPKQKAARMQAKLDNIDDSECCMCFTTYEEDIQGQTGKEWVACACG